MAYQVERKISYRRFRIMVDQPVGGTRSSQSGILAHQEWMKETGIRDLPVMVSVVENSFAMPEYADKIVPFPGETIVLEGYIEDSKLRSEQIWKMLIELGSCVAYKIGKSPLDEYKGEPTFVRVTFGRQTKIIRALLGQEADWATEIPSESADETRRPRRQRRAS